MTAGPEILVFSDLDGTLLDHATYDWRPARPALEALRRHGAGLILASSKTAVEMAPLRDEIGFADWPAIVENGSGILEPQTAPDVDRNTYAKLRAMIEMLPPGFRGFGDMSAAEVAEITGLSPEAAERAKARQFSEPGLWTGTDAALPAFQRSAEASGLVAQRGGRFMTLSFGGTKVVRMRELTARYRPTYTIALGDAPNDIEMLRAAQMGVIVANPEGRGIPVLPEEDSGAIRRSTRAGPHGWAEAVLQILDTLPALGEPERHG